MSEKDRARHHRRRALVYRPSTSDSFRTPPVHQNDLCLVHTSPAKHWGPRNLVTSPLERETKRLLSVQLSDIAQEVEPFHLKTPPEHRTSLADDWGLCSSLNPKISCNDPDASVFTHTPRKDSSQPPALSPPKVHGWGLGPLFHSVRSKLESFAEIFLTPIKSGRDPPVSTNSVQQEGPAQAQEDGPLAGDVYKPDGGSESPVRPAADVLRVWDAEDKPSTPPVSTTDTYLQLEITRPPLQRCLSCPLLPLRQHVRRHSLEKVEKSSEQSSCRRRRHSLGSVDDCRSQSPIFFNCLRKEKHPFVLWQGNVLQHLHSSVHNEQSPPNLCLDKDRVREPGVSGGECQVAEEPLPGSGVKNREIFHCAKESKVSNIQIRKRALRQEGNLTPLGLPKRVRLHKEDFSLEEIYTNKNYHTPTEKRKFETIFEEPIMKGGALILTSQRPLRRIMVFKDGSAAPRKRRRKGKGAGRSRKCTTSRVGENVDCELLLRHKMSQLEAALQEEEMTDY
ncbi:proline-rich protein 14 [Mixophyes fleayi]|uniref:proline-rich protein 14 n=1 Tax=Mixophyes fleayi TaxID=3061075 RepID=UPI003F4DAB96